MRVNVEIGFAICSLTELAVANLCLSAHVLLSLDTLYLLGRTSDVV